MSVLTRRSSVLLLWQMTPRPIPKLAQVRFPLTRRQLWVWGALFPSMQGLGGQVLPTFQLCHLNVKPRQPRELESGALALKCFRWNCHSCPQPVSQDSEACGLCALLSHPPFPSFPE